MPTLGGGTVHTGGCTVHTGGGTVHTGHTGGGTVHRGGGTVHTVHRYLDVGGQVEVAVFSDWLGGGDWKVILGSYLT